MNRFDLFNYRNNEKFIKAQIRVYKYKRKRLEDLKKQDNEKVNQLIKSYDNILNDLLYQQKNQDKVLEQLKLMNNTKYRNILFMYFIDGLSLKDISLELDLEYSITRRYKISALNEFDEQVKNID